MRAISTTARRELSSSFFFSCKARRRRKFTSFWQKHSIVSFLVGLKTYQHPCICIVKKVKVKQTLYGPGQAMRISGDWDSQISWQQESGKVVSPTHRPPLLLRKSFWYSFLVRGWVDPWGHCLAGRIISMTPSGIEPATFRLVAQCLNRQRQHCLAAVPVHACSGTDRADRHW